MAEEFPSFDLGFDFLNDQNNAETATDQKKRSADVKETETNQLLLEVQSREMSANAVETNSRSTTMFTMIHSDILSGMFNSCTIHSVKINLNRPQDKTQKVNCLNFRKFFQLCISLLEMISIIVDSFRFLSLVVIQILNQYNLSLHM